MGEEEAEREVVSTAPPEDESLADEEPSKPSPSALTMSTLSEQLAMALQRIATLEDERSR